METIATILFVIALVALIYATIVDLLPPALRVNQLTAIALAGLCILLLMKIEGKI